MPNLDALRIGESEALTSGKWNGLVNEVETLTSEITVSKENTTNGNVGIGIDKPKYKLHINGDAGITGTLLVSGIAKFNNTTTVKTLNVSGTTTLKGTTASSLIVNGVTSLKNTTTVRTLNVTGNTTLKGTSVSSLTVSGTSKLNGSTTIKTLGVTGNTSLKSTKTTDLTASGNVTANSSLEIKKYLAVKLNSTFHGTIGVHGDSFFKSNCFVDGRIEVKKGVKKLYDTKGYYVKASLKKWEKVKQNKTHENYPVSIITQGRIVSPYFITYSDKRFKQNFSNVNQLEAIQRLNIQSYNYKTEIDKTNIGLIAQEVEKILPHAVDKIQGFVPNIFSRADVIENNSQNIKIFLENSANVKVGTIVRIAADKEYDLEVIAIDENSFTVESWTNENIKEVFIYGTKVNDLRAIDYNYIFTLNVAFTQKLHKQMLQLKKEVAALKKQNNLLQIGQEVLA